MAILGLQGVRGGTGTTSITAALAWALQLLGETVLVVDASPYMDTSRYASHFCILCNGVSCVRISGLSYNTVVSGP